MRKPVKRKGYAGGGIVDAATRLGTRVRDINQDRADARAARDAGGDRLRAGDNQGMYNEYQRADIIGDRMSKRMGFPTKYPDDQPEGYPTPNVHGLAKGGKVKKMFEGSPKDVKQDKAGAKKMGVGLKAYERTSRDKSEDRKGQKALAGRFGRK